MKLIKVDFFLEYPDSFNVINLRKYVVTNLIKKGEIIRWSIIDIQTSKKTEN